MRLAQGSGGHRDRETVFPAVSSAAAARAPAAPARSTRGGRPMSTGEAAVAALIGLKDPPAPGGDADHHHRRVAEAFTRMTAGNELDLPLPGRGRTRARWERLTRWAQGDLSVARLSEAVLLGCAGVLPRARHGA